MSNTSTLDRIPRLRDEPLTVRAVAHVPNAASYRGRHRAEPDTGQIPAVRAEPALVVAPPEQTDVAVVRARLRPMARVVAAAMRQKGRRS